MVCYVVDMLICDLVVVVYVDVGYLCWLSVEVMVVRFNDVGVGCVCGFSFNVLNFYIIDEEIGYGEVILGFMNGLYYVIDMLCNGVGFVFDVLFNWCNFSGCVLGVLFIMVIVGMYVDVYLWIKCFGELDGICGCGEF